VSQLKISDFLGETFKGFVNCIMTLPVKSASEKGSFYTNNSKMPNFEL
jgi:hypothetical protein